MRDGGDALRGDEGHGPPQGGVELLGAGRGHGAIDGRHRAVLENAGGLVGALIADDHSPGNVLCSRADSCQPKSRAVGESHVPIEPAHEHRVVGRDRVDPFLGRKRRAGPVLVIPVASQYPLAGLTLGGVGLETADELLRRARRPQVDARELEPAIDKVKVSVHQSRYDHGLSVRQNRRLRTDEGRDGGAIAHGDDGVASRGDGAGPWLSRVAGPHPAVRHEGGRRVGSDRKAEERRHGKRSEASEGEV